jgi:hypothetical protein
VAFLQAGIFPNSIHQFIYGLILCDLFEALRLQLKTGSDRENPSNNPDNAIDAFAY